MVPLNEAEAGVSEAQIQAEPEERSRADFYALLSLLLRVPPDADTLSDLADLEGDDSELGAGLSALARAAGSADPDAIDDEFHALFVGIGQSEINPYGSYYLTGFTYEKPLADLRAAMAELGIERAEGVAEPEDHIASLCEIMCGLIEGHFGPPVSIERQRAFFDDHIAPWAERLFEDLQAAPSADLYGSVGVVGQHFMRIETLAFEMSA